jgi:hypothetical protein
MSAVGYCVVRGCTVAGHHAPLARHGLADVPHRAPLGSAVLGVPLGAAEHLAVLQSTLYARHWAALGGTGRQGAAPIGTHFAPGLGRTHATSAPGLGRSPCHICTGTRAQPCHICAGTRCDVSLRCTARHGRTTLRRARRHVTCASPSVRVRRLSTSRWHQCTPRCNTVHHVATQCTTLQHSAPRGNTVHRPLVRLSVHLCKDSRLSVCSRKRESEQQQQATDNRQHAADNMQQTICNMQQTTHGPRRLGTAPRQRLRN